MNLGQIINAFYDYTNDEVQDVWDRDKVVRYINAGLMEVYRSIEDGDEDYFVKCIDKTITADSTGERIITLPDDFKRIQLVERLSTSGNNPVPALWTKLHNRFENTTWPTMRSTDRVQPTVYLFGKYLGVVNPATSYTLRIWYTHVIPELDTDDDIPEAITQDFHDLIALEAAKRAMANEGKPFLFEDLYQRQLASLQIMSKQRQRHRPRHVNVVRESFY